MNALKMVSGALTVLLLISMLSALSGSAEARPAAIPDGGISDAGLDEDGDGAFEALSVQVTVNVEQAGEFFLAGNMLPSNIDESNYAREELDAGTHVMELEFDGDALLASGIDGPYIIHITLFFQGELRQTVDYRTGAYAASDFGTPDPSGGASSFAYDGKLVAVEYEYLTVEIDVTRPSLTFYHALDGGENARFGVEYTRLAAYDDVDFDGAHGKDDITLAAADLQAMVWDHQLYFRNAGGDIVLTAVEVTGTVRLSIDGAEELVMVTFYYPTHHDEDSQAQRKFDITLTYPQPVNADALALRHTVRDLSGEHKFVKVGEGEWFDRLELISDTDGELHGYYEWTRDVELTADGEVTEATMVATAVQNEGLDEVEVEFNYPARNLGSVYHDPVVGVNPDAAFCVLSDAVDELLHHPAVYMVAALTAASMVMVSLRPRRDGDD